MDVMLQKHGAKHIYKVPEGLRELCMDISREVLRSQPRHIHNFIAEYVDTLLITRENTKVAVKVVNNILLGSQAILSILYRAGFTLEQIAIAAPRIQKAFREYLDAVDMQPVQICEDQTCDERSKISVRDILEATGATREDAERAATVIQAAFRGHYERMALNEAQGKVQWQKAVMNTLKILKKAGASQAEISKAARHIKYAYRGYYTRRHQVMDIPDVEEEHEGEEGHVMKPVEAIQAVAWMEMMYEDSGLTIEKANEAASIIQEAYRRYRVRRRCYDVQRVESTKSMVVEAILENLRQKLFERVMSREDIPEEYGTREDMMIAGEKLQRTFKEHLRRERVSEEGHVEAFEMEDEEEAEEEGVDDEPMLDEDMEEMVTKEHSPETEHPPVEFETKSEAEDIEELSTEAETEAEVMSERLPESPDLHDDGETEPENPEEFEEEKAEETEGHGDE